MDLKSLFHQCFVKRTMCIYIVAITLLFLQLSIRTSVNMLFLGLLLHFIKNFKKFQITEKETDCIIYLFDFFQFRFNVSYLEDYNFSMALLFLILIFLYFENTSHLSKEELPNNFCHVNIITKMIIISVTIDFALQKSLFFLFMQNCLFGLVYIEMKMKFTLNGYLSNKNKQFLFSLRVMIFYYIKSTPDF